MSILDSIKGEKKLSFNHWRYRLLHWTFNVKNPDPKNIEETGLPTFLYTHYCPLFHLTNLIALLSPLALFFKIVYCVIVATGEVISMVSWDKIKESFKRLKPQRREASPENQEKDRERHDARMRSKQRREMLAYMHSINNDWSASQFWNAFGYRLNYLDKEEIESFFTEFMPKIKAAQEAARIRKEKWRQRIIFWTNFSRVFLKWFMNIAYILLTLFILWLGYLITLPLWHFLCWMCNSICWLFTSEGTWSFALFAGRLTLWIGLFFGLTYVSVRLFSRLRILQLFYNALVSGLIAISPPFYLLAVPFKWFAKGVQNLCDFVSMFYEENCPPITLVNDEEAMVEAIAQNEEEA